MVQRKFTTATIDLCFVGPSTRHKNPSVFREIFVVSIVTCGAVENVLNTTHTINENVKESKRTDLEVYNTLLKKKKEEELLKKMLSLSQNWNSFKWLVDETIGSQICSKFVKLSKPTRA